MASIDVRANWIPAQDGQIAPGWSANRTLPLGMIPVIRQGPRTRETLPQADLSGLIGSSMSDSAICTKPLARQTLRVRYFRHYGLPQHPESFFAFRL